MKGVEVYGQVRRAVYVEGLSRREAARRFGIDPEQWRRCWRSRYPLDTGGASRRRGRSWTGSSGSSICRSTLAKRWR